MKKQLSHFFSILELLIVVSIMAILAMLIFVVTKGVKDGARKMETEATINTCKTSIENVYNYIFNQARANNLEVYQHPLFKKVWPSNKVWTFRDKDETEFGIKANGLLNMINIGSLGVENKSIVVGEMQFPDYTQPQGVKTLIDGWGYPILLIRNEMQWHAKKLAKDEPIIAKVYQDRTKSSVATYARYRFKTDIPGDNLYEWNDPGFDHVDSKGVTEASYEVAPVGVDGFRNVRINGKIAVPYNNNDFDFFSPGKDGKIGNLIRFDMKQDRWFEKKNNLGDINWTPSSSMIVDPDDDNIVSWNRISTQ